jgi:hypothetical protein
MRPEPRGVQGCHAPYVVHGGVRSKILLRMKALGKNFAGWKIEDEKGKIRDRRL